MLRWVFLSFTCSDEVLDSFICGCECPCFLVHLSSVDFLRVGVAIREDIGLKFLNKWALTDLGSNFVRSKGGNRILFVRGIEYFASEFRMCV
jgi:hypothetical protein